MVQILAYLSQDWQTSSNFNILLTLLCFVLDVCHFTLEFSALLRKGSFLRSAENLRAKRRTSRTKHKKVSRILTKNDVKIFSILLVQIYLKYPTIKIFHILSYKKSNQNYKFQIAITSHSSDPPFLKGGRLEFPQIDWKGRVPKFL